MRGLPIMVAEIVDSLIQAVLHPKSPRPRRQLVNGDTDRPCAPQGSLAADPNKRGWAASISIRIRRPNAR